MILAMMLGLFVCLAGVIIPSRQASRIVVPSSKAKWYSTMAMLKATQKKHITHKFPVRLPKDLAFELWDDLYNFFMIRHALDETESGYRYIRQSTLDSPNYDTLMINGARIGQGTFSFYANPFEIRIICPKTEVMASVYIRVRVPQLSIGGKTGPKFAYELIDVIRQEIIQFTTLKRKAIKKRSKIDDFDF